jgi:hypothetical protein
VLPDRTAYSVSGRHGAWIDRADGRRVLVGSQRVDELVDALEDANP